VDLKLYNRNIMADGTLKVGTITTSSGSGTITIGSGVTLSGQSYPAFHAYLSADQTSISGNSNTKVQINTEVLDTDNAYDNSTNYRFTPQSAGKYFVYANLVGEFDTDKLFIIQSKIFKNGSVVATGNADFATDSVTKISQYTSTIVDMNGSSDYVEFYGLLDRYSGGTSTGIFHGASDQETYFGAYKLGA
tara:strand:+ start:432 stop:1004 length:573 start_codon:yes stop_codon:yes gene_type:complete